MRENVNVSENYYHNRTNRINWHMRENQNTRIYSIGLDARKFSCAKISTFTVFNFLYRLLWLLSQGSH